MSLNYEHKNILRSKHPEQSDNWITCEHIRTFSSWLQTHLMGTNIFGDELYSLARAVRGEADNWVHGRSKEVPPYYMQNNDSST